MYNFIRPNVNNANNGAVITNVPNPLKNVGAENTLTTAANSGIQSIIKIINITSFGRELFLGGAHVAARLDCDVDDPLPPPTVIRPLLDNPTPPKPLFPFRVPPDQTILKVLVLDELQLGQFTFIAPKQFYRPHHSR